VRTTHRTLPRRDQKQARMAMLIAGGLVFLVFVSCVARPPNTTSASSPTATSSTTAAAAAPPRPSGNLPTNYQATLDYYVDTVDGRREQGCASDDGAYDGEDTCQVGGETVVVTRAIDGDTVELADGRRVRILGVDAPEVGACGADAASAYTQDALVGNRLVVLRRESGLSRDQDGRELGYLQYVNTQYDTDKYWAQPASQDLGAHLAIEGLADVDAAARANPTYMEKIGRSVDLAKEMHGRNWGPPCGKPAPTYEPAPADDDSDSSVHVDVDNDDGESRFCRRHWWC
jgi:endonuclease YncB( thermonuclease family)